jgi:hypothetical protein
VLHDGYAPPSPLRDVAANRSVDQLAPDNPLAAEMAQMRETLEDIRKRIVPRTVLPEGVKHAISVLRNVIKHNVGYLDSSDFDLLAEGKASVDHLIWVEQLRSTWHERQSAKASGSDPWAESNPRTPDIGVRRLSVTYALACNFALFSWCSACAGRPAPDRITPV